jgi:hypothetical protein
MKENEQEGTYGRDRRQYERSSLLFEYCKRLHGAAQCDRRERRDGEIRMAKEAAGTVDISQVLISETLLDAMRELQSELVALALMLRESNRMQVDSTKILEGASTGGGENACWV